MDSESVKKAIIQQVLLESSKANSQQLFQKVNEHCFEKCIPKPGNSMSSSETTCVTQCMEKYIAAWNSVNAALLRRLQADSGSFAT
ncbi:hypothetical protein OQA88_345 [Cercophora sp. LCS_1]